MENRQDPILLWLKNICNRMFEDKEESYRQISSVIVEHDTLLTKVDQYENEKGQFQHLLCVYGTIPISFNSAKFNIPVKIWFPRDYPKSSPYSFVVPAENMILNAGKNIDKSGRVIIGYVQNWNSANEGKLIELLGEMRREFSKEPPMFSKPAGYVEAVDKNANKDMWGDIKLLENKYIKESGSSKPNPEATRSNPDLNSEFNGEKNATRLHSSVVSGTVGLSAQSKLNFGGAARFKTAGSGVPNYNPLILNNVQNAAFIGMKAPVNKRPSLHSDNEIAKTSSSPTSLNSSKSAMESNASEVGNISSKPEFAEENSSEKAGAHNLASDTSKDHKVNENKSSFDRPPLPTLPRVKPWSASTNSPSIIDFRKELAEISNYNGNNSERKENTVAIAQVSSEKLNESRMAFLEMNEAFNEKLRLRDNIQQSSVSGMSKNMNLEQVTAGVTENPTTTNVKKTSTQAQSVRHDLAKTRNRTSLMDSESPMDEKNLSVKYKLAILDKLVDEMFKFREIHTKINHDLIQDCSELSNSNAIIEMEKKEMVSIADRVDKKIHVLKKQLESLETQYATAQMKCEYLSNTNKLEPENFFGGTTPIQDQLLSVSSEIHALDDAIYYLGKALDVERIDLQTYLKNVRKLSQQQFLAKALANKLRKMANLNIG